jgi:hypothetical protein
MQRTRTVFMASFEFKRMSILAPGGCSSYVSLDPAVYPDLDYARLRKSLEYFVEHYGFAEHITSGLDPVKLLDRDERFPMSRKCRALVVAIADFIGGTQDFCGERVSEIDRDLQNRLHVIFFCAGTSQASTDKFLMLDARCSQTACS